ncbi:MAG: hypothetical protein L0Z68_09900 [Gammaproteobacteria bacterium]|nr:hypothetical protein [Gammaproteobacteria bacterium]
MRYVRKSATHLFDDRLKEAVCDALYGTFRRGSNPEPLGPRPLKGKRCGLSGGFAFNYTYGDRGVLSDVARSIVVRAPSGDTNDVQKHIFLKV